MGEQPVSDVNVLYGNCACGGMLTVEHLRRHCPLRPQQATQDYTFIEEQCRAYMADRLDTSHVAVLGED